MFLKQLLQQPGVSGNLRFLDPFHAIDRESLVREVIALANADLPGPRYLVFGVNRGAMEGRGIVGIAAPAMATLKKAHRLISGLVDPVLHLAFVFDRIDGKTVGALEIDGCNDAPYTVRQDFSDGLAKGRSWIRDGGTLRLADTIELEQVRERVAAQKSWDLEIGLGDRSDRDMLCVEVPDTSEPPSARFREEVKETIDWKEKARDLIGTVNTQVLRLFHVRQNGVDVEFDPRGTGTLRGVYELAGDECAEADAYYYFEEKALKLNLTICNREEDRLEDVHLSLAFPRLPGLEVADRLRADPDGKRTALEVGFLEYPEVEHREDRTVVRGSLGALDPTRPQRAFDCDLRLAVGQAMRGKKIAIQYTLRARNKLSACRGRLKLKFGRT
jgi:hypothetical protein